MSQLLNEFGNIDIDRLVYNLNSLNDVSLEITSDSSLEVSLSNLLRILMGTLGATKGAILLYAPYKLAFESCVVKGFEGSLYFRAVPKEINEITNYKESVFINQLESKFPDFIKRNQPMFDKNKSDLWITLSVKGRLVGSIILGKKLGKAEYEPTDIILLSIIANQISIAIANFQLIDELKKTNDKLRKQNYELGEANFGISEMRQISVELSSIMDVTNLLETFMERSIQYLSCSRGILFKLEGENLRVIAVSKITNLKPEKIIPLSRGGDLFVNLIETGEPQRLEAKGILDIEAKYLICVPLKSEREILGILCLFDKESRNGISSFSERDEAMIISLANHTSTLWQKARFYEMATIDGLTQLYVRRFLEQRMSEEIRKAQRLERKLSIMLIDIDHFKKFNDTWGHQTGDDVLRTVAKKIKDNVRKGIDIPARYGGEELTVVMPETDANGAMILAERIRYAIESTPLDNPSGGEPLTVTVSMGVSIFPDQAQTVSELIEKADIALYKSKASGRNKVTLYGEE